MKLYHAGVRYVASNTRYPNMVDVQNVEQLLQVVKFDHVAAAYKDSRRASENFLVSDALMMDVDNAPGKGQPDIAPSEWVDLDRIRADMPDVEFYAVTSRSHMKEKDGRPPRPKYHLYFRIPETTNASEYRRIKDELANAKDSARFFYGNDQAQAWFYPGNRLITDWIAATPEPQQKAPEEPQTVSRPIALAVNAQSNESRIRDALNAIPCSMVDRDQWIKLGMAINSLGWPDGLQTWDAWSSTDPARYKPGECARKWRGFKAGPIDHTYIIHMAQEYGWTPQKKQTLQKGEAMQKQPQKPETVEAQQTATQEQTQAKPSHVALLLQDFQTTKYEPLPTGIEQIDRIINGGFFIQTLVTLGAHPGAGKTLITQQMFEGVAREGKADVCYVNLEMSEQQLIARSLSRMTGYTPLEIMQGYAWTLDQKARIFEAAAQYEQTIGKHFYYLPISEAAYYESIIEKITETEKKRKNRDIPFIVILDYIQLLQSKQKLDDTETIKAALKAFKDFAISKERKALVFMIMAHSRALNESGVIVQGAGRDTSSLEYSADLQLSINYLAIATDKAKSKADMRTKIKEGKMNKTAWNEYALTCTKNRFGKSGEHASMRIEGEKSRFVMLEHVAKEQTTPTKGRHIF